jgi:ABC-2 type transport system ATP-binding protein
VAESRLIMLQIHDLHKSYGSIDALNGCTFAAAPGRMLGFLGPNGAGKTTAMRAIFGLVAPDRGSITWNGKEIGPEDRMRFGYMPESRGLYPKMRVADQLTYFGRLHGMGGTEAASAARELLDRLGLGDRARDQVEKLSHGNQQRVQLAAALINEPELLVLDEPFSGLDPLGVATLAEVLAEKAERGTAVVFSSHQLDLVEDLCEDVVIIHRGRVVRTGPVEEIKDASPVRHLEIELADGMVPGLDGLEEFVTSREGNRIYLQVPAELDVRPLMGGALATGSVRRFVYTTPSLSEIFIEAVS